MRNRVKIGYSHCMRKPRNHLSFSERLLGSVVGVFFSSLGLWHMWTEHVYARDKFGRSPPQSMDGSLAFQYGVLIFALGLIALSLSMPNRKWALRWLTCASSIFILALLNFLRHIYR